MVIVLANQIGKYVEVWELLAVEDPQQLLAAINQIQSLLDATLAGFLARTSEDLTLAVDHATQTLDFLHLAHCNLISELGSTPPIMRLVRALSVIRSYMLRTRVRPTVTIWQPITFLTCGLVAVNTCVLLALPSIPSTALELIGPTSLVFVLFAALALAWSLQTPFGPQHSSIAWLTSSVGVSLEPLTYMRQRLQSKETETKNRC